MPGLFRRLVAGMVELSGIADVCASKSFVEVVLGVRPYWQDFKSVRLRLQLHRIDVLAVFEFEKKPPLVVAIEDKIDARICNPINQYRNKLIEDKSLNLPADLPAERIHLVIFKTGFDFYFRPPQGWTFSSFRDLSRWITSIEFALANDILRDWCDCKCLELRRIFGIDPYIQSVLGGMATQHNRDYLHEYWSKHDFQFEFMRYLFEIGQDFEETNETAKQPWSTFTIDYAPHLQPFLVRGRNLNGQNWIQLWLTEDGSFFYRLDWFQSRWGLSLRTYKRTRCPEETEWIGSGVVAFEGFLERHHINRIGCRPNENGNETSRVLIDLCAQTHLETFVNVHRDFIEWLSQNPAPV